jgi:hypothetical protein
MFAHHDAKLPETLLPDDVADLLARLGYRVDRRNLCRALEAADIPGVVPPSSRAARWTIPCEALLDVTAAVLQRRELRAAAPGRRSVGPLERYRLSAALLLMQEAALSRYVPLAVRRQIQAEIREREKAAQQRVQDRLDREECYRRAEERWQASEFKRVADSVTAWLYAEARWRAMAIRGADPGAEWPGPNDRPDWWLLPPDVLAAAVELWRPYLAGKANVRPAIEHLLPDIDYSKPWLWRADEAAE